MSFILDALKKSETDRQRQAAPALFEVKVAAPRRRFPVWAMGLVALLGVNMAVLAYLLLRQPEAAPPVAAAPAGAVAPSAGAAPHASPSGEVTVPATVTFQVNVPSSSVPGASPLPAEPGVVAPSSAPPLVEEPLLSGQETPVPPDYDAGDYRPAITVAEANATAAARRSGLLPSRDEMLARGQPLPELRLDLHVYDPEPSKRFVFINMRKLREGEMLPEGVRVDEITAGGAKLSFRGNQFTLGGN
jgi:general secretion pathway protein B